LQGPFAPLADLNIVRQLRAATLSTSPNLNHLRNTIIPTTVPLSSTLYLEVREICGYDGVACSWLADGACYRVLPSDGPAWPLFLFTGDMKLLIAMAGPQTIRGISD
jgi:hypothetical protein